MFLGGIEKKLVASNVLMENFFYAVVYSHIHSVNENTVYITHLNRKKVVRSCLQNMSLKSDIRPPL